jgi:hypothetical protein
MFDYLVYVLKICFVLSNSRCTDFVFVTIIKKASGFDAKAGPVKCINIFVENKMTKNKVTTNNHTCRVKCFLYRSERLVFDGRKDTLCESFNMVLNTWPRIIRRNAQHPWIYMTCKSKPP